MNWLSVTAALAVPVLSYIGGLLTFRYTKRDIRSRIEADVALLEMVERADTPGANKLRFSIDHRLWILADNEKPRPYQRIVVLFLTMSTVYLMISAYLLSLKGDLFQKPPESKLRVGIYGGLAMSVVYMLVAMWFLSRGRKRERERRKPPTPQLLRPPTPTPPIEAPVQHRGLFGRLFRP